MTSHTDHVYQDEKECIVQFDWMPSFSTTLLQTKLKLDTSTTTVVCKTQLAKLCRGFLALPEPTKKNIVGISEVYNLITFHLKTTCDYIYCTT